MTSTTNPPSTRLPLRRGPAARPRSLALGLLGLVSVAFLAGRSSAETSPSEGALAYSGVFESRDGEPLTGEHDIEVQLWTAAGQGEMLCTSDERAVELANGRFSVVLPEECEAAVRENPEVFVEVILDRTLLGRTKIGAVPYALTSERAHRADTISAQSLRVSTNCEFFEENTTDCWCDEGEAAISGGACVGERCGLPNIVLVESRRADRDPRIWRLACENDDGTRVLCESYQHALCLRVTP